MYRDLLIILQAIKISRTRLAETDEDARKNSYEMIAYELLHIHVPLLTNQKKTYLDQLGANTRCSLEELPGVIHHRDGLR